MGCKLRPGYLALESSLTVPSVEEGIKLNLVNGGHDIGVLQQFLEMADHEVAHSHCSTLAIFQESLHRFPGIISRRGDGKMDQIEIYGS
jgi:hypothetical protein